jgi:hypothetical protein
MESAVINSLIGFPRDLRLMPLPELQSNPFMLCHYKAAVEILP